MAEKENSIEIYTLMTTLFALGGTHIYIKTNVENFERMDIGRGYFGLLVRNTNQKIWHMVEEQSGGIIGTDVSRSRLIEYIKEGVENGDSEVMEQQIVQGKKDCQSAKFMGPDEFFTRFRVSEPKQMDLPGK